MFELVDSIIICAETELGVASVWSGLGQVVAELILCLPLSLDRTGIIGGGLIDLSTTGYHGAMNYSLLYHYSDSHHY